MNKSYSNSLNNSFWILTVAVFIILIIPRLIQEGMFVDGVFYAAISRNLAHHLGTFWNPHYSETLYPSLHEQPPLMFWLQAQFFRLMGDSFYVERIYSLLTAIVTAIGINMIWREQFKKNEIYKPYGWLAILFWIIIPVCNWTYINNLEECTLSMFDVYAVYFIIKSFNKTSKIPYLLCGGLFIFLATLTKGPQGLFPLCIVGIRYITHKDIAFKKMMLYTGIVLVIPVLFYTYFYTNTTIRESFHQYYLRRFVLTFNNQNQTTNFRLYLFIRLIAELSPIIIITTAMKIIAKRKFIVESIDKKNLNATLFFLLLGLSASLPLMITLEQRGFYLTTSFPYYAMAFTTLALTPINSAINYISSNFLKLLRYFFLVILASGILFSSTQIGKIKRDEMLLHDLSIIGKTLPNNTIVSTNSEIYYHWSLHAYFQRYFNISLEENSYRHFLLLQKSCDKKAIPEDFSIIEIPTVKFDLYEKRSK